MKFTDTYKYLPLVAGAASVLALTSEGALATQTKTVSASVVVSNTLTLAIVDNLNFGKIAVLADGTETASILINADTGARTIATTGTPAVIAMIDATNAKPAQITIADGAPGATLNLKITNVVAPTDGSKSFTLGTFTTSYNSGADTAQVVDTPFTVTYPLAGGTIPLDIGAKLSTTTTAGTYADATFTGAFDVTFSY